MRDFWIKPNLNKVIVNHARCTAMKEKCPELYVKLVQKQLLWWLLSGIENSYEQETETSIEIEENSIENTYQCQTKPKIFFLKEI